MNNISGRFARAIGLLLLLQGCAAAGMTALSAGAGVGMGTGVEHTLNGIVYKTFAAPVSDMRFAALKTLDRMRMPVRHDEQTDEGWMLSADAADRSVEIELQRLTEGTTRMRVVVNEGQIFFKDSSTATEIILQTAQTVDSMAAAATASPPAKVKGKTKGAKS